MADHEERVRTLLRAASEVPHSPEVPVGRLVAAGRRSVRRQRIAVAAVTVCVVAVVVVVPTVLITNRAHRITAAGPTGPASSSAAPISPSTISSSNSTLPTTSAPLATMNSYATTGPGTATALAHAHWTPLPDAPIAGRRDPANAWTGTKMLVWGGSTDTVELGDGASYDPATRSWETLPTSPIGPRTGIASAWTGSQWFLWGGQRGFDVTGDGAVYDPAQRTWTAVSPSPLSARGGATAVWTGTEVLVIGGYGTGRENYFVDAAAYNPATRSWRRVASNAAVPKPEPRYPQLVVATAVGPSVYVVNLWSHTGSTANNSESSGVTLSRYDPWTDSWTPLSTQRPHQGVEQIIWTGRDLLVPASQIWCGACSHPAPMGSEGQRLDVASGIWSVIPHGPLDDFSPADLWTGAALVVPTTGGSRSGPGGTVIPGDSAAWDATTNKWTALPHSPYVGYGPVSLWTGRELLVWGLDGSSSTKAAGASLG